MRLAFYLVPTLSFLLMLGNRRQDSLSTPALPFAGNAVLYEFNLDMNVWPFTTIASSLSMSGDFRML